jgi:hypothetical protein
MPNRSEVAVRAMLPNYDAADKDGIWTIAALCVIGALVSICFAACFQSVDDLPTLIAQVPWG